MLKTLVKSAFRSAGLKVEWRDRLQELIEYPSSPFLPTIDSFFLPRLFYQREMLELAAGAKGDLVECGTYIGHGLLPFILASEVLGLPRHYYAFDSFEGFPAPTKEDDGTHLTKGFLQSAPELLLKVLRDGRVPEEVIQKRLHVVKGFFDQTLPKYEGQIGVLHLDCDLYDSYRVALGCLYDKVVKGGVIMFDEYLHPEFPGADRAIDEFFADKPEKPIKHRFGNYYLVKQ
jgi:hypothetical protein